MDPVVLMILILMLLLLCCCRRRRLGTRLHIHPIYMRCPILGEYFNLVPEMRLLGIFVGLKMMLHVGYAIVIIIS